MTTTPEQMRALADREQREGANYAGSETFGGTDPAEERYFELVEVAAALRYAADQLEAVQRPMSVSVDQLDSLPEGTVVVGANGIVWMRSEVGYPADGRLAWFPLEVEVGSGSRDVGDGARIILAADTALKEASSD